MGNSTPKTKVIHCYHGIRAVLTSRTTSVNVARDPIGAVFRRVTRFDGVEAFPQNSVHLARRLPYTRCRDNYHARPLRQA